MKKFLILIAISLVVSSCDCEKEDFTPYPGGKSRLSHSERDGADQKL